MSRMSTVLAHIARDTRGVTAIEYGLLAGLVAVASVQAMGGLGDVLDASFGGAASQVSEPAPAGIPAPGGAGAPDMPTGPDAPVAPDVPLVGDPTATSGGTGGAFEPPPAGIIAPDPVVSTSGGAYEPPVAAASVSGPSAP